MIPVTYLGPKPQREIEFPVPLLSLSERTGERVTFVKDVPQPLAPHLADQLRAFPEAFHVEPQQPVIETPAKPKVDRLAERLTIATNKRFTGKTGKWKAKAYIKQHKLEAHVTLQHDAYGWFLVVTEQPPIAPDGVGQEESHGTGSTDSDPHSNGSDPGQPEG